MSALEQLAADINEAFPDAEFVLPEDPTLTSVVAAIKSNPALGNCYELIFNLYIENSDLNVSKDRLQQFYSVLIPDGIESYIRDLITPKAKASFTLSAGLQFPREYLQPVYGPKRRKPIWQPRPGAGTKRYTCCRCRRQPESYPSIWRS